MSTTPLTERAPISAPPAMSEAAEPEAAAVDVPKGRSPAEIDADIDRWAERVVARVRIPLDAWAVAATLESEGLRDIDARERFARANLFELAEEVYTRALELESPPPQREALTPPKLRTVAADLVAGALFALPLLGQSICILLTGYSLWASLYFTPQQATVVGLGTLGSFVLSGGLVTAIGREGSVHRSQRTYELLRHAMNQLVAMGLVLALVAVVIASGVELLAPAVDLPIFLPALAYFASLTILWITMAVLFALGLHAWSLVISMGGALLVAAMVRGAGVHVFTAQIGAIVLSSIVSLWLALRRMDVLVAGKEGRGFLLGTADVRVGMLLPYAAYGLGYFGLLFADRALAWTAGSSPSPQPIWFRAPYEVGMDWALCSLLLPMVYIERAIRELVRRVENDQLEVPASDVGHHRATIRRYCVRAFGVMAAASVVSVIGTWAAGQVLARHVDASTADLLHSTRVAQVFWPAAIAYQFLAWGLLCAVFFFLLNRNLDVVAAIWRALLPALVVGFVASRLLVPEAAVFGLLVGAAGFGLQMLWKTARVVRDIDFYYYSAF